MELPLTDPDIPALSTRLACPTSSPRVLGHIDVGTVSDDNFKLFCDALASCSRVHTCCFVIEHDPRAKVAMLCDMLTSNRSIRRLEVIMQSDKGKLIHKLLKSLETNESVCELTITSVSLEVETAGAISDFFAHNRTLTKFRLSSLAVHVGQIIDAVSVGMRMNPVIVHLRVSPICTFVRTNRQTDETIQRNKAVLNRAVDFVVLRCMDKRYAESFELFSGRPCFLAHLMKSSGQPECEALVAISSAENFLRDNYLVIAGIVKRSVVCHPADDGCTQLDKLSADCWHAILRHLKVADVLA